MKTTSRISSVLFIIISSVVFSQNSISDFNGMQFNSKSTVFINIINTDKKNFVYGQVYQLLLGKIENTDTLLMESRNIGLFSCEINMPTDVDLFVNDNIHLPLFLVPNDTLHITLDLSDSSNIFEGTKYNGKYSVINQYELYKKKEFGNRIRNKTSILYHSEMSPQAYEDSMDCFNKNELNYLHKFSNSHPLPEWFINYETNKIYYYISSNKLNRRLYRKTFLKKNDIIPPDHQNFPGNVKVDNKDAVFNFEYYNFLNDIFGEMLPAKIKEMEPSNEKLTKYIPIVLKNADSLLTGDERDIFICGNIIALLINIGEMKFAESIINEHGNKLAPKYLKFVKDYFDSQPKFEGSKAPDFYLPDRNDNYFTMADFKNKVVLLNFWFPGCVGCRMDIPFEKKLVETFNNNDFCLINICMETPKETWTKALDKLEMKGIHLFASENWGNILRKSFNFVGFPHYTLIDKKGNVISNNPRRPSDGLENDIREILKK